MSTGSIWSASNSRWRSWAAWLDTGTHESLLEAGKYVEILERRQGLKISCPEEIAYYKGSIDHALLIANAGRYGKSGYGDHLARLAGTGPPRGPAEA